METWLDQGRALRDRGKSNEEIKKTAKGRTVKEIIEAAKQPKKWKGQVERPLKRTTANLVQFLENQGKCVHYMNPWEHCSEKCEACGECVDICRCGNIIDLSQDDGADYLVEDEQACAMCGRQVCICEALLPPFRPKKPAKAQAQAQAQAPDAAPAQEDDAEMSQENSQPAEPEGKGLVQAAKEVTDLEEYEFVFIAIDNEQWTIPMSGRARKNLKDYFDELVRLDERVSNIAIESDV
jgi:ferredoxin